jgi:hypothetical protein
MEDRYDGIPVSELRIDSVLWLPEQAAHIRCRSARYLGALDTEPWWATEAALDRRALVGLDPDCKTGESIRVTGWSRGAGRVLTVILIRGAHPPGGTWIGATAWATTGRNLRDYGSADRKEDQ